MNQADIEQNNLSLAKGGFECEFGGRYGKFLFVALKNALDEVDITFDTGGITMLGIDSGRIALYKVKIDADDLIRYEFPKSVDTFTVSIDMDSFKFLKTIPESFIVKGNVNDENIAFNVVMDNVIMGIPKITFTSGIKIEALNMIEYNGAIEVEFSKLDTMCKVGKNVSETVDLTIEPDTVNDKVQILSDKKDKPVTVMGRLTAKMKGLNQNYSQILCKDVENVDKGTPYKHIFDVEIINSVLKFKNVYENSYKNSTPNFISLLANQPMKMIVVIGANSSVVSYIAPRVEENDDDEYDGTWDEPK